MADRTWNRIDAKIWDEWKLSKCARCCLAMIISISPNQYGIFDPSPQGRVIDWFTGVFSREDLDAAFEELEAEGVIRRYREGRALWLVKKFKRELAGIKHKQHAEGVGRFLQNHPEIKEDFEGLYTIQIQSRLDETGSRHKTQGSREGQLRGLTDSDSDSDTKKIISGVADAPPEPPKERPKRGQDAEYPQDHFDLAEKFIILVERIRDDHDYEITNPRGAPSIAAAMFKSKLGLEKLRNTMMGIANDPYQRKSLTNLAQWTKPGGWKNAWNKVKQKQEINAQKQTTDDQYYNPERVERPDPNDPEQMKRIAEANAALMATGDGDGKGFKRQADAAGGIKALLKGMKASPVEDENEPEGL